jgi:hypothetical protein
MEDEPYIIKNIIVKPIITFFVMLKLWEVSIFIFFGKSNLNLFGISKLFLV